MKSQSIVVAPPSAGYNSGIMEIRARITTVEKQDTLRREDMLRLTPTERIEALIEMRDHFYPYQPLERVVSIRSLH